MANLIEKHSATQLSPLITFHSKSQTQGSPLFCFPGAGGHFLFCQGLDRYLREPRPIYGMRELSLEQYDSIEAMAAIYVHTIQQVQPHGAYVLAGYSFGALVALEVAQQLCAQAETISQLILIDPSHPPVRFKLLRQWLKHAAPRSWLKLHWALYRLEVHSLRLSALSGFSKLSYIQNKLQLFLRLSFNSSGSSSSTPTTDLAEQKLSAIWQQYELHSPLRDRYVPQQYDQPVCILLSEDHSQDCGQWANWRSIVSSSRYVSVCSSDHQSICEEPSIKEVVSLIESQIESYSSSIPKL